MKRIDIMLDLETLGLDTTTAPIIQLCAVAFDITTGENLNIYNECVKMERPVDIDPDTLKWWLKTNPLLLDRILQRGTLPERLVLAGFLDFIQGFIRSGYYTDNIYVWGNGIIFDNSIIKNKFKLYNLPYPLSYRSDRDVRTYVDAYMCRHFSDREYGRMKQVRQESIPNFQEHDAFYDCLAQIMVVSDIYNRLDKNV